MSCILQSGNYSENLKANQSGSSLANSYKCYSCAPKEPSGARLREGSEGVATQAKTKDFFQKWSGRESEYCMAGAVDLHFLEL